MDLGEPTAVIHSADQTKRKKENEWLFDWTICTKGNIRNPSKIFGSPEYEVA